MFADIPTPGLYVGEAFAAIAAILIILGIVAAFIERSERKSGYSSSYASTWSGYMIVAVWAPILGVLVAVITLALMWPLKYEYHHYISIKGPVTQKSSRFIPSGDSVQQRIVLVINGNLRGRRHARYPRQGRRRGRHQVQKGASVFPAIRARRLVLPLGSLTRAPGGAKLHDRAGVGAHRFWHMEWPSAQWIPCLLGGRG